MSRRRRSTRTYAEKRKSIEGTSQLEIDREDTPVVFKKEKKHKPSRRGSRGRGLNKKESITKESNKKESPVIKDVEFINTHKRDEDPIPHYADRIVFIIAKRIDSDNRFVETVGKPTTTFREAVRNCPPKYSIYTSEGIKVYPIPPHRLSNDKYSVRKLDALESYLMKYSDLSEAIKNCKMGYGVFDPQNERVY